MEEFEVNGSCEYCGKDINLELEKKFREAIDNENPCYCDVYLKSEELKNKEIEKKVKKWKEELNLLDMDKGDFVSLTVAETRAIIDRVFAKQGTGEKKDE